MRAREGVMESRLFGEELHKLYPVVEPNLSDSGCADNVLEFLVMAGERSLPEVRCYKFNLSNKILFILITIHYLHMESFNEKFPNKRKM